MKKTKQKTKKKITTKSAFIYGLIGGFSIFAIFLLIVILIGYASIPKTQSVNAENQTYNYPMEVQRALTPPNDYDFGYYYSTSQGRFVAHNDFDFYDEVNIGDDYVVNDTSYLAFNSDGYLESSTYNHYHNTDKNYYISSILNFTKTSTLFGSLSASNTDAVPKDNVIQLSPVSDASFSLAINNQSPYNLKLNLDMSSSARHLSSLANFNDYTTANFVSIRYDTLNYPFMIPAFMNYKLVVYGSTAMPLISFDAYYLTSLGLSNSYAGGYDTGYTDGYGVGIDNGYDTGYFDGYDEGLDVGYDDGYLDALDDGYNLGYDEGYTAGLNDYASEGVFPPLAQSFNLIRKALGGGLDILSLEVMPGVSIFGLLLVPFVISLFWVVIKFLRG